VLGHEPNGPSLQLLIDPLGHVLHPSNSERCGIKLGRFMMPNVSKDGLEIVFASTRQGGAFDIYGSTRSSVGDPWSSPVNLGPAVNTDAGETRPSLSWDGERLYFGRAGEIYVSERAKD
jgi:Tol biopolymer transport system component